VFLYIRTYAWTHRQHIIGRGSTWTLGWTFASLLIPPQLLPLPIYGTLIFLVYSPLHRILLSQLFSKLLWLTNGKPHPVLHPYMSWSVSLNRSAGFRKRIEYWIIGRIPIKYLKKCRYSSFSFAKTAQVSE
jgi:hypothetical protein